MFGGSQLGNSRHRISMILSRTLALGMDQNTAIEFLLIPVIRPFSLLLFRGRRRGLKIDGYFHGNRRRPAAS